MANAVMTSAAATTVTNTSAPGRRPPRRRWSDRSAVFICAPLVGNASPTQDADVHVTLPEGAVDLRRRRHPLPPRAPALDGAAGHRRQDHERIAGPDGGFQTVEHADVLIVEIHVHVPCLLYTSPSPRDGLLSRMPSS